MKPVTNEQWESNAALRKKPWISTVWPWIAAGAFMSLLADLALLLNGLAAFHQGATDVGIAYMVLMALFPPVTIFAAWRSGREEPRSTSKAGGLGKRGWLSRLMSLMDMGGHLMPLVLLLSGCFLAGGVIVLMDGRVVEGAIYIVMGAAFPVVATIPMLWIEEKKRPR